jgi:hypothetical protein
MAGHDPGLSVREEASVVETDPMPSPLLSSLGSKSMVHSSANFPSNIQLLAMSFFIAFYLISPLIIIVCFYRVLPRNEINKGTF